MRPYDLASRTTTEIAPKVCLTGNEGYRPVRFPTRSVRGVGVHDGGLVIDDGALVNIGFDGSHRVIAAVGDTIEGAALHGGAVYFISSGPPDVSAEYRALRRVSLEGGVVEELARFGPGALVIGAFNDEHVFVDHHGEDGRELLRIAL